MDFLTCIIVKSVENYKNGISADLFFFYWVYFIDVVRCSTTSIFSTKPERKHREIFEIFQKYFMKYFRAKKSWNFTSLLTTDYDRTISASTKRCSMLGPREHVTPCFLQLHWLPVRWRIHSNCAALCIQFSNELSGVFIRYRTDSECQQTSSSLSIIVIDRLGITTTSHQVRRARLFLCWSVCMEQTAWRHLYYIILLLYHYIMKTYIFISDIANFRKFLKNRYLITLRAK